MLDFNRFFFFFFLLLALKEVANSESNVLNWIGPTFLHDEVFIGFFAVMDGISANDLFHASAFSKGYIGKCAKGFLVTFIFL